MEKIISIEEADDVQYDGFAITTDKQVIKLLIDNCQCCCENWGYFMSQDDFTEFIGASLIDIKIVDHALRVYDVSESGLDEGEIMFVNIYTSNGMLQFVAYNAHNGYYSHEAKVVSQQLTHSESL